MTTAWVPLATTTLGSATGTVTFGSIPSGYRDLVCVFNGTTTTGGTTAVLMANINGTGTSGSKVAMFANGATPSSDTDTNLRVGRLGGTGGKTLSIMHFMDYSATDKHKTIIGRSSSSDADKSPWAAAAGWPNTAAITSIAFTELLGANFAAGSTFSLYGSNRL